MAAYIFLIADKMPCSLLSVLLHERLDSKYLSYVIFKIVPSGGFNRKLLTDKAGVVQL
jgi:hypothetical protein